VAEGANTFLKGRMLASPDLDCRVFLYDSKILYIYPQILVKLPLQHSISGVPKTSVPESKLLHHRFLITLLRN
jgi:hypothetical protein